MSDKAPSCEVTEKEEKASLVSVVIPVYNVSSYLAKCLKSVIQQSYHDMEIIIIDDGSTDGSGLICDEFAQCDDRIRVIHTENKGLASARNLGLEKCRGSYLLFVDSDDWIEPYAVETLVAFAKKYKADIVTAKIYSEFLGKTLHPTKKEKEVRIIHGDEILTCFGDGLLRNVVWDKLYLAGCFSGVRFPDGHNYEDVSITWKMMRRLAKSNGTVVVLSESLFHFRVRKSSISHTQSFRNIIDGWTAYHEKFEGVPEYRKQSLRGCLMLIGHMWMNYSGFSREEKGAAAGTVTEMCRFSKEHFKKVMKGTYSLTVKAICLVSQSSSPLLMWACFCGGKLLWKIRNIGRRLYT